MSRRLPALALGLLLIGFLLAPAPTAMFVKSSVGAAWHSVQTALDSVTRK